jgi:hypothetical protein
MLGYTAKMSRDSISLNRMKHAPHPPYLPDLEPSDFPFGYIKGKLIGYFPETPSELLVRIGGILTEIPPETLNVVFLKWMDGWMGGWMGGTIAKICAGKW